MVIDYLSQHPEFVAPLAPEIAAHWGKILPEETVTSRTAKLEAHLNRDVLPIAWVAHADGVVLGTAALRRYDLEGREDLSPWLGGVFVREAFRGRGIAAALCEEAEAKAWSLGIEKLYLFTIDHQALYTRLGWKNFERATWRGIESTIMFKSHKIGALPGAIANDHGRS